MARTLSVADHRTDYYRAVNALDLVEWLASQTSDVATLNRYVERLTATLAVVTTRRDDASRI